MIGGRDQGDDVRAILAAAGASGTWDWDIAAGALRVDGRFAELHGLAPEDARRALPTALFFKAIHPAGHAAVSPTIRAMNSSSSPLSRASEGRSMIMAI